MATSYITNAALAQQITDLLNKWQTRETQMQAWMGGTATGGPYANGTYPLTDVLQNTTYQPSPAALVSGVGISSSSAAASATAAAASATAAAGSATAATASATAAATSLTNATTQATNAASSASNAASSKALAQTAANTATTQAAAAVVSAAAALASQTAAAGSATAAATSATAAAASATAAAASAVLAATFVPALYALLAGSTFTGAVTGTTLSLSSTLGVTGTATMAAVNATNVAASGTLGVTGISTLHALNATSGAFTQNVTIAAPTSGVAFTVTGLAGQEGAIFNGAANGDAIEILGSATSGQSFGAFIGAGTTSADYALKIQPHAGGVNYMQIKGDGSGTLGPSGALGLSWDTLGQITATPTSAATSALTVASPNGGPWALQITRVDLGTTIHCFNNNNQWYFNEPVNGQAGLLIAGVSIKQSGSFTGTLTGMSGSVTGTFKWVSDSQMCMLYCVAAVIGTSTSTAMTLTGLPAAIQPVTGTVVSCGNLENAGGRESGNAQTAAASGTITLTDINGLGFTASGSKGLLAGWCIFYPII